MLADMSEQISWVAVYRKGEAMRGRQRASIPCAVCTWILTAPPPGPTRAFALRNGSPPPPPTPMVPCPLDHSSTTKDPLGTANVSLSPSSATPSVPGPLHAQPPNPGPSTHHDGMVVCNVLRVLLAFGPFGFEIPGPNPQHPAAPVLGNMY